MDVIKSSTIFAKKIVLKSTDKPVTPFAGFAPFFDMLNKIGYADAIAKHMPIKNTSNNFIDPAHIFTAFIVAVAAGAKRFAHAGMLRSDVALRSLMGIDRFPSDDAIRDLFKKFDMKQIHEFFDPLSKWCVARAGLDVNTLDLDSTVFTRYGNQDGAKKGYNPNKKGRNSHHPILATLSEGRIVLNGWLRSGDSSSANGATEFLAESLSLLPEGMRVGLVRADSGFCGGEFFDYLESNKLKYIVVGRMSGQVKSRLKSVRDWRDIGGGYSVGGFTAKLYGWNAARRFVVIREEVKEEKKSRGKKLFDTPGYTYRVLVTNVVADGEAVWRRYNGRADMENRIKELKEDLFADKFCMKRFFSTEAAFRSVLFLFNLLSEFGRVAIGRYRQPGTLRSSIFTLGGVLGREGSRVLVYLSESWGGLGKVKPLFAKVESFMFSTSRKLVENGCGVV
jgi:hypothetical protein